MWGVKHRTVPRRSSSSCFHVELRYSSCSYFLCTNVRSARTHVLSHTHTHTHTPTHNTQHTHSCDAHTAGVHGCILWTNKWIIWQRRLGTCHTEDGITHSWSSRSPTLTTLFNHTRKRLSPGSYCQVKYLFPALQIFRFLIAFLPRKSL